MKILFLALVLFPFLGNAYEDMPEYLKDSKITVTLKNGKQHTFDGNHWKVVRRGVKEAPKTVHVINEVNKVTVAEEVPVKDKNTIVLQAGVGYRGLNTSKSGSYHLVEDKLVPVLGLTYCRDVNFKLAPCATATTHETFMFGVKYGF
jgi:hypothetical protein